MGLAPTVWLIVGVLLFSPLLAFAAHPFFLRIILRRRGVSVTGVCTGYSQVEGTFFCWYEYRNEEFDLSISRRGNPVSDPVVFDGDDVEVIYDRFKPHRALMKHEMKIPSWAWGILSVVLVQPMFVLLFVVAFKGS
ncbi:hypothetical protein [Streptomyces sp. H27-D2]|uniref:hypothetical protein n=1 Tax=Streptomyces sp. H27-D2 TaxID=3046304 RepID=UPI002DBFBF6B|nr:hypothetical protein [Streptomyces sp. H27-D2]MEC4016404.1 hypothetical protein [Streptomyces sp. H27-D2]